jgi:hypothetical protein
MANPKNALLIGYLPELPGPLSAAEVSKGLDTAKARLEELGYPMDLCLVPDDDSALGIVEQALRSKRYDCICIGGGLRLPPAHTVLFEKLMNIVHRAAPQATLCFSTSPADAFNAVRRAIEA